MSKRRVVVTGMGIVSPVGNTLKDAWSAITEGQSGIGEIQEFDASAMNTRIAGEIKDFEVTDWISPKDAKKFDKFVHYGMAASMMALADAGIDAEGEHGIPAPRIGAAVGAGIGGIRTIEKTTESYLNGGPRKVSPFFIPGSIVNMIGGYLSMQYNLQGPNIAIVTACTTATHNIGSAMRMIQYGDADVMVAGGAEYATTPTAIAGFGSARAMSTRNDDPHGASRPWDEGRDGFVLSNGAGVLVLEELEHAKARGANIYAEVKGFGMSGDAHHMTAPPEDGNGAARCMATALADAGMAPEDIDYINAHGTSTPLGDLAEARAVHTVFGHAADSIAVSSTKSMTGHLLGAAGGVEAIFSLLALRDGVLPPTINLENPSEGCDLDFVPNEARQAPVKAALSNSFGFGGTNGSLVFARLDD
ncbi:beta-ketoacyl-ACP synthase II [Marinihelvus fidelis]|uniref:3-oxoacyl-[acyl-carrier-protein] synthase 2 n=1 Tax=Marinihelvus fidelis TaxID=2613842 RepID=A0A5N0TAL3_9GAMM|nr:beta-ketoacyl-ACP synthase II [Marinihelvus fidelis]KAA9132012.1 beta-ketoacyl-ACP synthase II [Marinihelvus fidelis]